MNSSLTTRINYSNDISTISRPDRSSYPLLSILLPSWTNHFRRDSIYRSWQRFDSASVRALEIGALPPDLTAYRFPSFLFSSFFFFFHSFVSYFSIRIIHENAWKISIERTNERTSNESFVKSYVNNAYSSGRQNSRVDRLRDIPCTWSPGVAQRGKKMKR